MGCEMKFEPLRAHYTNIYGQGHPTDRKKLSRPELTPEKRKQMLERYRQFHGFGERRNFTHLDQSVRRWMASGWDELTSIAKDSLNPLPSIYPHIHTHQVQEYRKQEGLLDVRTLFPTLGASVRGDG